MNIFLDLHNAGVSNKVLVSATMAADTFSVASQVLLGSECVCVGGGPPWAFA